MVGPSMLSVIMHLIMEEARQEEKGMWRRWGARLTCIAKRISF